MSIGSSKVTMLGQTTSGMAADEVYHIVLEIGQLLRRQKPSAAFVPRTSWIRAHRSFDGRKKVSLRTYSEHERRIFSGYQQQDLPYSNCIRYNVKSLAVDDGGDCSVTVS